LLDLTSDLLAHQIDAATGTLSGADASERHLSQLRGCFADQAAFEAALAQGDPLVYSVASVERDSGDGALRFGLGTLYPGRVGQEYYLTKGHYHSWRAAAEVYIGISGAGGLLLETEDGQDGYVPLAAGGIVYVPGHTAHRTVNTGTEPFVYLGVYPAEAGHDYGAIADNNFRQVVVAGPQGPAVLPRAQHLAGLAN
jgi:glucose-6-phosphate isomerase